MFIEHPPEGLGKPLTNNQVTEAPHVFLAPEEQKNLELPNSQLELEPFGGEPPGPG